MKSIFSTILMLAALVLAFAATPATAHDPPGEWPFDLSGFTADVAVTLEANGDAIMAEARKSDLCFISTLSDGGPRYDCVVRIPDDSPAENIEGDYGTEVVEGKDGGYNDMTQHISGSTLTAPFEVGWEKGEAAG